jgi:large subunit ribosomal protein L19e
MNLSKKKNLAVRALKVGKERVVFVKSRLDEIKEAITKQDIRDLKEDKAILLKEISGRKKKERKRKRSTGNIRKKVKTRKKDYVTLTKKLRAYIKELKNQGKLSSDEIKEIRKKIRNKNFRSKAHLREHIGDLRK